MMDEIEKWMAERIAEMVEDRNADLFMKGDGKNLPKGFLTQKPAKVAKHEQTRNDV